ncbi:kinase-like domain-containing protein [Mycena amicta]|nr:kinase-like domain-containing protein [Mycena amicta]
MEDDSAQSAYEDMQPTQPNEHPTQPQTQPTALEPTDELWGYLHPCSSLRLKRVDFFKSQPEVTIGRNVANNVIFPGFKISNFHAEVQWNMKQHAGSEVLITDKSSNGTYINGEKIGKGQQRILKDGNEVAFGVATVTKDEDGLYDYRYVFRDFVSGAAKRAIYSSYDLSHQLGKGSFATVYRALHRASGEWVAVKVIHETKRQGGTAAAAANTMFSREINIMENLRHPNICMLREVFWNTNGSIDLVLELVEGGDLLDFILQRSGLSEPMARHITYQLCQALAYIHSKGITHRDLKPENVLLTKDDPPIIKVADFGLAKIVDSMTMLRTMCGTPSYLAPEVVTQQNQSGYDSLVDSWSVGVILFSMLTNTTPFIENSVEDLRTRIAQRTIEWGQLDDLKWVGHGGAMISISPQVTDITRKLLDFEPQHRLKLKDALKHDWLRDYNFHYRDAIVYPQDDDVGDGGLYTVGALASDVSMRSIATTFSFTGQSETDSVSQGLKDLNLYAQRSGVESTGRSKTTADDYVVPAAGSNGTTPPPEIPQPPILHKHGLNRRRDVLRHAEATGSQLPEPSWEMVQYANSQSQADLNGTYPQASTATTTPMSTATGEMAASGSKTPRAARSNGKGPNKRVHSELTPLPEERDANGNGNANGQSADSSPLSSPGADYEQQEEEEEEEEEEDVQPARKRGRGNNGTTPTVTKTKRGSGKASGSARKTKGSTSSGADADSQTPIPLRRSNRSATKTSGRR